MPVKTKTLTPTTAPTIAFTGDPEPRPGGGLNTEGGALGLGEPGGGGLLSTDGGGGVEGLLGGGEGNFGGGGEGNIEGGGDGNGGLAGAGTGPPGDSCKKTCQFFM